MLFGPVGVGKTHVAQALGHLAVRQGAHVRFAKTSRILADLAGGHADRTCKAPTPHNRSSPGRSAASSHSTSASPPAPGASPTSRWTPTHAGASPAGSSTTTRSRPRTASPG
ncbi:ATP-binding protein [Streptomyces sp. NPDC056323]|uniref:ATP-binding protein n=1 Tax=unclassified Streptomyces TaxID=2593676 RepID=UPI0035DC98A9